MSSKLNYFSCASSIDGTSYCSGVETLAENIVEDNEEDAVIVFPSKDGWASLRSTAYRMTTENAEAVLPLPIYKIRKISINVLALDLYLNTGSIKNYIDTKGKSLTELDITNYVVTMNEWNSLPASVLEEDAKPYYDGFYKDNTFYWEEGSDRIAFVGNVYKLGNWFTHGFDGVDESPTYKRLLGSAIYRIGEAYKDATGTTLQGAVKDGFFIGMPDVRDWLFRIEYVPISTKTKIRARKAAKTREEFIQPFNQRAEINAASAFGKNMYLTAQKTGVKELVVVKRYTSLAEIPPIGTMLKQDGKTYRLVANNYKITNTIYVQVTHVYSENWSRKSQHVSVDQKYRNWKIPQDILWRNLYREDYLICSTSQITPLVPSKLSVDLATRLFMCGDTSEDKTITTLCWLFTPKNARIVAGVTVPCSTYGTANSMVFSATFKDNLSAGLTVAQEGTDSQEPLCEEAFYCNEDGTLDKATVILSSGLTTRKYHPEDGTFTDETKEAVVAVAEQSRSLYPKIHFSKTSDYERALNAPKDELYRDTYKIFKDPGEALKYTYQVHVVPNQADLGTIVIGDKFAELSPLVREWGETRKLNLVLSKRYLRDGENIVAGDVYTQSKNEEYFYFKDNSTTGSPWFSLQKNITTVLDNDSTFVAWAICDEKNRLLIGCNDTAKRSINFIMAHKR